MSDEWIASYTRRARIEAWFGIVKAHPEGGIRRGWTRHVGLIQTSLMLALTVAAINLRHLVAWARETEHPRRNRADWTRPTKASRSTTPKATSAHTRRKPRSGSSRTTHSSSPLPARRPRLTG